MLAPTAIAADCVRRFDGDVTLRFKVKKDGPMAHDVALKLARDYHTSGMCGRYTLTADLKKVVDRLGAPAAEENWAGTQAIVIVWHHVDCYPAVVVGRGEIL
jgi:hypothetical protein